MSEKLSLVCFKIGDELYGINIMEVKEIIHLCEITPIPNAPEFIDGVINLRGNIIPIIDLCKKFNLTHKEFTEDEELLRSIVIINVNELLIGIIIDQIYRVVSVMHNQIQPPPQMISGVGSEYVQGVVKLEEDNDILLVILNVKRLFNKQEFLLLSGQV